ncbi:MAG: hypothetical protein KY432_12140 [Acidobacteria bacterium]|nr:hypothetical protein [Acidobacteriota bacterium]
MNDRPNSQQISEHNQSLWRLTVSPLIWAGHFLACYLTAAIWCAKFDGGLMPVRGAIAVYTILALMGIGITGWRGYRRHDYGTATVPHDFDTPEDRHRFLGFATLLLSGLSFVAVIYAGMVAFYFRSCI